MEEAGNLVRPEGLEPPAYWFEVRRYSVYGVSVRLWINNLALMTSQCVHGDRLVDAQVATSVATKTMAPWSRRVARGHGG